jgi:hypothetical protein
MVMNDFSRIHKWTIHRLNQTCQFFLIPNKILETNFPAPLFPNNELPLTWVSIHGRCTLTPNLFHSILPTIVEIVSKLNVVDLKWNCPCIHPVQHPLDVGTFINDKGLLISTPWVLKERLPGRIHP